MSQIVALNRATPFLTGIGLSIFLMDYKKSSLPKGFMTCGWIASAVGCLWCYYTPSSLSRNDYIYEPISAAQYYAIAPLIFSLCSSWIIFACYINPDSTINKLLSSRPAKIMGRISFSIYLNVFLILFYFNGTVKSAEEFQISSFIDRVELFFVFLISILFAILVDQPARNIVNLIGNCKSSIESKEVVEASSTQQMEETINNEEDFDDPFADRDDDYVFRSRKTSSYNHNEEEDTKNSNEIEFNW